MAVNIRQENDLLIINNEVELRITVDDNNTIMVDTYKYVPQEQLEKDFDEHDFDEDFIETFYL